MPNNHSFHQSKSKGKVGENLFQQYYPKAKQSEDKSYDFKLYGKTLDIKTDFYNRNEYPSYFIEYISNDKKGTKGSLFNLADLGIYYFVYYYIKNNEFHWFRVKELAAFLENKITKYKKKTILNKTYRTIGYLVPIKDLKDIIIKIDRF